MSDPGLLSAQRAKIDDSSLAGAQFWSAVAGKQKWSTDIGGKHVVPLLFSDFSKRNSFKKARVIYQHINAAKPALHAFHSSGDARGIAHVTMKRDRFTALSLDFSQVLLSFLCGVQISKSDLGAFPRYCQCNGAPQMDCAAGNHNRLAL